MFFSTYLPLPIPIKITPTVYSYTPTVIRVFVPEEAFRRGLGETNSGEKTNYSRHSSKKIVLIFSFISVHDVPQRLVVIPLRLI